MNRHYMTFVPPFDGFSRASIPNLPAKVRVFLGGRLFVASLWGDYTGILISTWQPSFAVLTTDMLPEQAKTDCLMIFMPSPCPEIVSTLAFVENPSRKMRSMMCWSVNFADSSSLMSPVSMAFSFRSFKCPLVVN